MKGTYLSLVSFKEVEVFINLWDTIHMTICPLYFNYIPDVLYLQGLGKTGVPGSSGVLWIAMLQPEETVHGCRNEWRVRKLVGQGTCCEVYEIFDKDKTTKVKM